MALIRCPECDREVSERATICPNCGFPIFEEQQRKQIEEQEKIRVEQEKKEQEEKEKQIFWCRKCYRQNAIGKDYCEFCGNRLTPYWKKETCQYLNNDDEQIVEDSVLNELPEQKAYEIEQSPKFNGIYRISFFGNKTEVYCPICGSSYCSWYTQEKYIPGKTKTRYTANLNPLKPFTLVNKKEKVVRKERIVEEKKIICNSSGHTFS